MVDVAPPAGAAVAQRRAAAGQLTLIVYPPR
jgi:hypothetical protein